MRSRFSGLREQRRGDAFSGSAGEGGAPASSGFAPQQQLRETRGSGRPWQNGDSRVGNRFGNKEIKPLSPISRCHCERSEAIQGGRAVAPGLLRHCVPRNDGVSVRSETALRVAVHSLRINPAGKASPYKLSRSARSTGAKCLTRSTASSGSPHFCNLSAI